MLTLSSSVSRLIRASSSPPSSSPIRISVQTFCAAVSASGSGGFPPVSSPTVASMLQLAISTPSLHGFQTAGSGKFIRLSAGFSSISASTKSGFQLTNRRLLCTFPSRNLDFKLNGSELEAAPEQHQVKESQVSVASEAEISKDKFTIQEAADGEDKEIAPSANRIKSRAERRRRSGLFARAVQHELPDLLTVPGIGPRNFEKLVAKGIAKVSELKQLYREKFLNDESKKMVEYLQSSVGIVHKNHAESITSYVKHCVDEEIKEKETSDKGGSVGKKKKVTICVEGNISVGKTTFLQRIANEIIELRDMVEIVPEPVDKWKDVGPDHFNLLDAFYNEPERYAYTFQNYVFATRLMKEQETSKGMKGLRLMERSIFSDRLVFVRAVHEAKWMSELELRIYESWFDPFISALPGLVPDGFIYLRASPDTCMKRLHMRNRPEERGVTLEYLKGLHEKHEQCFFPSSHSGGIYSVSDWISETHKVPPSPRIRDNVFYLEGDHLHSSIRKVPALILDCEASIDFNRDPEARAEYGQKVAEFYEYIRNNKDLDVKDKMPSSTASPLLIPNAGGLFKPDGSPLFSFAHSPSFMSQV